MKKIIAVLLSLFMAAGISGCNSNKNTYYLNFPTASTSGSVYSLGATLANLWNENIDGIQVSAEASNGGVHNLVLMSEGDAKLGVAVTSIITQQKEGTDVFNGHQYDGARIICSLYSNYNQVVATERSGIETLPDIKGKRFAPGAAGSTPEVETRIHLEALGFHYPDDISGQFVGFTEAVDLMRNQQLDGAWIQSALPVSAVSEMCSTAGGHLVPMTDELVDQLCEEYPWYNKAYIPAGTYDGQDEDILTTSLPITLIVDESVPEEVVYQMTKIMWENIDTLKTSMGSLKNAKLENAIDGIGNLPLHEGAKRYYKEMGIY